MILALAKINLSIFNPEVYVYIWASHRHVFFDRWIPPLYQKDHLALDDLQPDAKLNILSAVRRIRWMSKRAYEINIPKDYSNGSHMQQLFTLNEESVQTKVGASSHVLTDLLDN